MTDRLPQTTPRKIIQALQQLGFVVAKIKGSHYILRKDAYETCVAYHSNQLSRNLQMKIIRQAGLSIEEIRPYL